MKPPRPRYIALEAWEAAALIAGTMTQKRVPIDHWHHAPRPGALIWVQEPFVEWTGVKDQAQCAIGYRADAGPGAPFPPQPAFLKNVHTHMKVCEPKDMRAGDSRLTLEVIKTEERARSIFADGDEDAEALSTLCVWEHERDPYMAFRTFWMRRFKTSPHGTTLVIKFRVHAANVSHVIKQRAA